MDCSTHKLKVLSFNCKHFRDSGPKFDFINECFASCDVLLLQEHCLYSSEFYRLAKIGNCAGVESVSPMCENVQRFGRPFGGCAIVWNPRLKAKVDPVKTNNNRSCAINLVIGNVSFLIVNVYMPCDGRDPQSNDFKNVLDDVTRMVHNSNSTYVIIGGDFNTDTSRNSSHVNEFQRFVNENSYNVCIDNVESNVPYTFIGNDCSSRIDHFLVSDALKDVSVCSIIDNHLYSDHVPLVLTIDYDVSHYPSVPRKFRQKIAWHKVTDEDIKLYKSKLDYYLGCIVYDTAALSCLNVMCNNHNVQIEKLYADIIDSCCKASDHFPVTCATSNNKAKCIPGWNMYVSEFRKEALSWHHIWKAQGRPHTGEVANMHRVSRAKYHRAVRYVKRNSDKLRMERMADAIVSNNSRDLWGEVKRIKGSNSTVASNIDGCSNNEDIAQLFCNKYDDLYNSVSYDSHKMYLLEKKVNNLVVSECNNYHIGVFDINKAITNLKSGKSGGCENLFADHVIHGTRMLTVMLSLVYNSMIVHAYSPVVLRSGLMVPIPKDRKKSLCSSDNYRAIALNSILCKILDLIILNKESNALCSSDLQFGFKSGLSTTHCTFLLQETISHYNYNHTNVYTLLLDASKAFDRVNYCKLFEKLISRKMSPLVVRLLLHMYTNQSLQVQWDNITSDSFSTTNGVKQGAVLSPLLFAVYVDGLLHKLREAGIGCYIGEKFVGALSFADDLTLVCPTLSGLKKMVKICEDYAAEYYVKFNGAKSKLLVFSGLGCKPTHCNITVCNETIAATDNAIHLGHHLSTKCRDSVVNSAKGDFWRSFNLFMANFGHLSSFIKNKLFVQYCCYFYGAPLWYLSGNGVSDICTSWRKALRCLWGLHPQTHCDIVIGLSGHVPLLLNLQNRFCKFLSKCLGSKNVIVNYVTKVAIHNPVSSTGKNYLSLYCRKKASHAVNYMIWQDQFDTIRADISALKELISIRDGMAECLLSDGEVLDLIESICCS